MATASMASDFADATLAPLPALLPTLAPAWQRLGQPGSWWSGAERLALAHEARAARDCALCAQRKQALSPYSIDEHHVATRELPAAAVDAVHRITSDPGRLTVRFYREAVAAGLLPEQVVELTGVVALVTLGDTLARACGATPLPLPRAVAGKPSRVRLAGARVDDAWVPMVHPDAAEGQLALMYQGSKSLTGIVFNVMRALSAVPEESFGFFSPFLVSYQMVGELPDERLSHPQQELLASTTSALNECFY